MKNRLTKRHLFLAALGGAALTPISVAASCGNDSNSSDQKELTYDYAPLFADFKPVASSTHSKVIWPGVPTDVNIKDLSFHYSDVALTFEQVKALANEMWTITAPREMNSQFASRYLWVKIITKNASASSASTTETFLDITASSQIASVKTDVSVTNAYQQAISENYLAEAYLDASDKYKLGEVEAPEGTKIVYDRGSGAGGLTKRDIELNWELDGTLTLAQLSTYKAYLEVSDPSKYVLSEKTQFNLKSNLSKTIDALSSWETEQFNKITPTISSLHTNVTWNAAPAISPRVASITYLNGAAYVTIDDAKAAPATAWKTTLPTSVEALHQTRNLWARVTPTNGYTITEQYYNLNNFTLIRQIKTLIDEDPDYANYDPAKFLILGDQFSPQPSALYMIKGRGAVFGLDYRFNYLGETGLNTASLVDKLKQRSEVLTVEEVQTIEIYFVSASPGLYFLQNTKKAKVLTVNPDDPTDKFKIVKRYV